MRKPSDPHGKSAAKAEVGGIHKALRCGGGSRAALPAGCVACDGHGDQIETADTAVRRIEVKKPLPFAIRRRPTCSASSRERSTHRFGFSARHRGRAANFNYCK